MKRKKFLFKVKLCIEQLSSVPFVSGVLFTKLRVEDGSKFKDVTTRVEVKDHMVLWDKRFEFECKLLADLVTGVLQCCICRLSVRKEVKGGKSFQKLGYVDLNLAEYAGQGLVNRSFILQGYTDKHRLDNSLIRCSIQMCLTRGDPLFKVPAPKTCSGTSQPEDDVSTSIKGNCLTQNLETAASSSSLFDSLTRISKPSVAVDVSGHSRNSSSLSETSKNSVSYGTSSKSHSRAHSVENGAHLGHMRNSSSGSNKMVLLRKTCQNERAELIEATRVDPDDLVNKLLGEVSLEEAQEEKGLQLFIGMDGTASITGHPVAGKPLINR